MTETISLKLLTEAMGQLRGDVEKASTLIELFTSKEKATQLLRSTYDIIEIANSVDTGTRDLMVSLDEKISTATNTLYEQSKPSSIEPLIVLEK